MLVRFRFAFIIQVDGEVCWGLAANSGPRAAGPGRCLPAGSAKDFAPLCFTDDQRTYRDSCTGLRTSDTTLPGSTELRSVADGCTGLCTSDTRTTVFVLRGLGPRRFMEVA